MVLSRWRVLTHFFPQHLTHLDTGNPPGWVAPVSLTISLLGEHRVHTDMNRSGLGSGTPHGCYKHHRQHHTRHTWPFVLALSGPSLNSWIMRHIGILYCMALALGCTLESPGEWKSVLCVLWFGFKKSVRCGQGQVLFGGGGRQGKGCFKTAMLGG